MEGAHEYTELRRHPKMPLIVYFRPILNTKTNMYSTFDCK